MNTRKLNSYQCRLCGENIGWLGRFIFQFLHKCEIKEYYEEITKKIIGDLVELGSAELDSIEMKKHE